MSVAAAAEPMLLSPTAPLELRRARWVATTCVLIGLAIRLYLAATTIGTNDTITWRRFGIEVRESGFIATYQFDAMMNHPPIFVVWAWMAACLTDAQTMHGGGPQEVAFGFIMKLPAIAADVVAGWLLWRLGRARGSVRTATTLCCLLALSPVNILVSGFHGNTDNVYACFTLAAFMCQLNGRPFTAGTLLGAAINVKLIPILLIPALFASCRSFAGIIRSIGGLAVGVIPFLPLLWIIPGLVFEKILKYASNVENWGMTYFLQSIGQVFQPTQADKLTPIADWYFNNGRWIMLVAIIVAAAWCRRRHIDALTTGALGAVFFLLLAPGFGAQYLVLPAGLLLASNLRFGAWYAGFGGLFLAALYYVFLNVPLPLQARFWGLIPTPASQLGMVVYGILVAFVLKTWIDSNRQKRLEQSL